MQGIGGGQGLAFELLPVYIEPLRPAIVGVQIFLIHAQNASSLGRRVRQDGKDSDVLLVEGCSSLHPAGKEIITEQNEG